MKRLFLLLLCVGLCTGSVASREVVFVAYNVDNFAPLVIPDGVQRPVKSKESADAVLQIIGEMKPDILGVCEMGEAPKFEEFRRRLEEAGLRYIDAEFVKAADADRHLALVSRFPIVARNSVGDAPYEINGTRGKVRRGFLDVTVELAPGCRLRIIGVHLKSKLSSPDSGDTDLERRQEARLLRKHIDAIHTADPALPLLVFGDFNDTKEQSTIQEISGPSGSPQRITPLRLADSHGDRWTHYWKVNDVYARIDFLFTNRALAPWVVPDRSGVHRSPLWNKASDHRPIFVTLAPPALQ